MPNARRVGHQYERDVARELRELLSDEKIKTSRYASKELDDNKVDISGTQKYGLNIQCKRYKNTPNLFEVIGSMPQDGDINTIFWKKPNRGELVIISKKDFYHIIKKLLACQKKLNQ
jgi:hypothetical protein